MWQRTDTKVGTQHTTQVLRFRNRERERRWVESKERKNERELW